MDFLAEVSEISEDRTTARVVPLTSDGVVTPPLSVHWSLRHSIQHGDRVVCLQFADGSGLVLCQPDGDWSHIIGGSIEVTDDAYIDGHASAATVTAAGMVSGGSVMAGGVSLTSHTHTSYGEGSTTSGPN